MAAGHGSAAWRATLGGRGEVSIRDGTLRGFDLTALARATASPELAGLENALEEGETGFSRLTLPFSIQVGLLRLGETQWQGESGPVALTGHLDLLRESLDLRIGLPQSAGPEIGLRFSGPLDSPRRLPETGSYRRWRSERN